MNLELAEKRPEKINNHKFFTIPFILSISIKNFFKTNSYIHMAYKCVNKLNKFIKIQKILFLNGLSQKLFIDK